MRYDEAYGAAPIRHAFRVTVHANDGHGVPFTPDTGPFWFLEPANLELIVNVLDACRVNDCLWVFAAGPTDVATEITGAGSRSDEVHVFENPFGFSLRPAQDTRTFAGCP